MTIKKALIATAGFGTRFLPITKTVQKEMLPILNRPTIDYVVEDCIKAGIEEILFVTNEHNSQVKDYYTESSHIKKRLEAAGKTNQYKQLEKLHTQAKYTFIEQKHGQEYGTGVPVKLAKDYLETEDAFLVCMGDDIIYNQDGSSETQRMIATFNQANAQGLITCLERPNDQLHRYGVVKTRSNNNLNYLSGIVEKPHPGTAPSNLINISKYIFTPAIFPLLENQSKDAKSNELLITDTIVELAKQHDVVIHTPEGKFLDSGTVNTWLQANLRVAADDSQLRTEIIEFAKQLEK